jgi:cyclophilin family peptidyl-prolyl cis-trans isomerase/HEAT repeat protein
MHSVSLVLAWLVASTLVFGRGDQTRSAEESRQLALDRAAVERILRAADRVIFDRLYISGQTWRALGSRPRGNQPLAMADEQELLAGVRAPSWRVRAATTRAIGRLETPADVFLLKSMLVDSHEQVRIEAANALVQALRDSKAPGYGERTKEAAEALLTAAALERDAGAFAMYAECLGELRLTGTEARRAEDLYRNTLGMASNSAGGEIRRRLGALEGIVAFLRHNPNYRLAPATLQLIRQVASSPVPPSSLHMLRAVEALALAQDVDPVVIRRALAFRCAAERPDDNLLMCGDEVRQMGLRLLRYPRFNMDSLVNGLLRDESLNVRIEALETVGRHPNARASCWPTAQSLTDRSPHVVAAALAMLPETCRERDDIRVRVESLARGLADEYRQDDWHVPMAAMTALVRFDPGAGRAWAYEAAKHKAWPVRAAAAEAAVPLREDAIALSLAQDPEPNVRTAVLKALHQLNSARLHDVIVDAFESTDHQLLLVAAALLKVDPQGAALLPKLAASLDWLNRVGNPTSRETRLEILARLEQFRAAPSVVESVLQPMLGDTDPVVAIEAARVIGALTGSTVRPTLTLPSPVLSSATDPLGLAKHCYRVTLGASTTFDIVVDGREAPYTADQFHALVQRGYYNGLTIHRVRPMSFAEGGSPAAHYYSGATHLRDEVGLRRASARVVGLSRHERHTGNMQFFVTLGPNPAFDRQFTLFGVVGECAGSGTSPWSDVLEVLPGTPIREIRFVPSAR